MILLSWDLCAFGQLTLDDLLNVLDDLWKLLRVHHPKCVSARHHRVITSSCDMINFVVACSHFSGSWSSASELWKHRWSPFNDHDFLIKMSKCEHGVMDQHLFSNLLQPSEIPASKQLATNHPVLIGLELEIVNSIVWRLLLTLTKTIPNRQTLRGFTRTT